MCTCGLAVSSHENTVCTVLRPYCSRGSRALRGHFSVSKSGLPRLALWTTHQSLAFLPPLLVCLRDCDERHPLRSSGGQAGPVSGGPRKRNTPAPPSRLGRLDLASLHCLGVIYLTSCAPAAVRTRLLHPTNYRLKPLANLPRLHTIFRATHATPCCISLLCCYPSNFSQLPKPPNIDLQKGTAAYMGTSDLLMQRAETGELWSSFWLQEQTSG